MIIINKFKEYSQHIKMPKKVKQQTIDSDSENETVNENEDKEVKSKLANSKGPNSSKLDFCVQECKSMNEKIDNLHTAIMRIDSSSHSEDFNIKDYIDIKFDEIIKNLNSMSIKSQNSDYSDNSDDEKSSKASKSSKKQSTSKEKPTPNNSFMTFKSEKKVDIAQFKEDNYPDHDCFDDTEGEDGKCSKRASSSKAAKHLWDQLDDSEQQEYYQKSLTIFEEKYGEPYVPKEKS